MTDNDKTLRAVHIFGIVTVAVMLFMVIAEPRLVRERVAGEISIRVARERVEDGVVIPVGPESLDESVSMTFKGDAGIVLSWGRRWPSFDYKELTMTTAGSDGEPGGTSFQIDLVDMTWRRDDGMSGSLEDESLLRAIPGSTLREDMLPECQGSLRRTLVELPGGYGRGLTSYPEPMGWEMVKVVERDFQYARDVPLNDGVVYLWWLVWPVWLFASKLRRPWWTKPRIAFFVTLVCVVVYLYGGQQLIDVLMPNHPGPANEVGEVVGFLHVPYHLVGAPWDLRPKVLSQGPTVFFWPLVGIAALTWANVVSFLGVWIGTKRSQLLQKPNRG
jgi:hypothetical protein